jgi:hypothetical protein
LQYHPNVNTWLQIDIDRHVIRYELVHYEQKGADEHYERASSPDTLKTLAAPVLESKPFAEPELPYTHDTPFSFYVVFQDGTWVERPASAVDVSPRGRCASLHAWLDDTRRIARGGPAR